MTAQVMVIRTIFILQVEVATAQTVTRVCYFTKIIKNVREPVNIISARDIVVESAETGTLILHKSLLINPKRSAKTVPPVKP
jgi:hypothetical protein